MVTMTKKALCVGINDYPYEGSDLNGCVNDAKAWSELLVDHYGFAREDVRLMLDSEATGANIMAALENLLKEAKSGDVLVFTNSSHGTYVADKNGDEKKYDEAICPFDCKDRLIIDDEIRVLFSDLPDGVSVTVISDSCYSGTVTRAVSETKTPDNRRKRFLNPGLLSRKVLNNPWKAKPRGKIKYPESEMKEVLLSGCSDMEYSYDAKIGKTYHGAMTYYALKAIKKAKYQITMQQLHAKILDLLAKGGYPQQPQLEGKSSNKEKLIFT
jgi:hypothetical protein